MALGCRWLWFYCSGVAGVGGSIRHHLSFDLRQCWPELLRTVAHNWDTFGTIEVDASETDRLKAMGYL